MQVDIPGRDETEAFIISSLPTKMPKMIVVHQQWPKKMWLVVVAVCLAVESKRTDGDVLGISTTAKGAE